ncbi:MAG: hypothetical protein R3F29_06020 [Planctomycetota bacterium]
MNTTSRLAPVLLLLTSCAAFGAHERTELLNTGRVTVTADVWRAPGAWSMRSVAAEAFGRLLIEIEVVVFADLDGDGKPGADELRGRWQTSSSAGAGRLAAGGKVALSNLPEAEDAALRIDVRAVFSPTSGAPSEDHAVVPFGS